MQLLRDANSKESVAWLASLKQQAKASPPSAFLLGKWMAAADDPATALAWLPGLPPALQTNQPVPLIVTDCQIALKDWSGLLALVHREDWGEVSYYRLALESLAQRSFGQKTAATAAWQKAVRQWEHKLEDSICRLAQVAAAWHWMPERTEVLEKIIAAYPKEKWALDQLVAQLYAQGDTRAIQTLLTKVQASDPIDARLKNNLANVFLLRNAEVQKANRLAKEAYDAAPNDPLLPPTPIPCCCKIRGDEALQVFAGLKTNYLRIPTVAAYYGVVEAQCGHNDIARVPWRAPRRPHFCLKEGTCAAGQSPA